MVRTFAKHVWLAAVLTAIPFLCSAQEKTHVIPIVPAADWRQANSQPLPLSAIGSYGGDPLVEKEYGVKALELRTYQLGKTRAHVLLEQAPDATAAYGLLTYYQSADMTPMKGVDLAVGNADVSLMARGGNFLRFLRGKSLAVGESDFRALLIFVGGTKPSNVEAKGLPPPMPSKGLVPGSEKYIVGLEVARRVLPNFRTDLLGFDQGAEVQLGQYRTGKDNSILVSISYPTPQIARVRFGAMSSLLGLNREQGEDSAFGKRHGSYIFLVLHAGKRETATALMNLFDVTQGISWDQKYVSERTFTVQLVHMIISIIILTIVIIGFGVLAGVMLYLSRRLALKYFPDWQWGHTDDDQLIRLNLKIQ